MHVRSITICSIAGLAAVVAAGAGLMAKQKSERIVRALTGGDPSHAPYLIRRYGCGGCHTIPGIPGGDGQVGGPLAGLKQRVYVGGVAMNTPDELVRFIVNPQTFSPHIAMPASGIGESEARDVAAYLYAQ